MINVFLKVAKGKYSQVSNLTISGYHPHSIPLSYLSKNISCGDEIPKCIGHAVAHVDTEIVGSQGNCPTSFIKEIRYQRCGKWCAASLPEKKQQKL